MTKTGVSVAGILTTSSTITECLKIWFWMEKKLLYQIVSLILMVVVVALPSWIVCVWARRTPAALTKIGETSGFGGAMILFVVGQVAFTVTALWQASYMTSELYFMMTREARSFWLSCMAVVPVWLTFVFGAATLWLTAVKRTFAAVVAIIVMLWLGGPCATMLQSWFFNMELTRFSQVQIFGWSILWTAYFGASRRVALTYATPLGRKIAA